MDKPSALQSLKSAYDAADDALVEAKLQNTPQAMLDMLDNQRQHALLSYTQALSESLVLINPSTDQIKSQLDTLTQQLNNELSGAKNMVAVANLVGQVVQLAGSLASAFA
jgi:hypothetical protein